MLKRYLHLSLFLLSLIIIFPVTLKAQDQTTENKSFIKDVSPKEAYQLINRYYKNGELTILDVRTDSEFRSGHLKGAINIDYYSENFEKMLNKLDKSKMYLVYCRSGARSRRATYIMKDLGFKKIYNMEGGFLNWEDENLPIVIGR